MDSEEISIPLESFVLGTFENTEASMVVSSHTEFEICWKHEAVSNEIEIKSINIELDSIGSIEQELEEHIKFIILIPKPNACKYLNSMLPKGFKFSFDKADEERFILAFNDDLEERHKNKLRNLFSSVRPINVRKEEIEEDCEPPKQPKITLKSQESERSHRSLRSRPKRVYVESIPEQDTAFEQAISESRASKQKQDVTTPRKDNFPDYPDFQDLFVYKSINEITVRMEDFKCLDRRELISNTVLDFYLQYIYNTSMTEEQRNKVYIFSSNFYLLYATDSNFSGWKESKTPAAEKRYERVQGLYSNVDIFDKDFLVFPCLDKEHWFLTIVCYPRSNTATADENMQLPKKKITNPFELLKQKSLGKQLILCFDSVRSNPARRTKAIYHIRNFLESEYLNTEKKDQFPFVKSDLIGCHVVSPQQKNATDCGLFVMEFVEHFFIKNPINDLVIPLDCSDWFDPKTIENHEKRQEVANVIKSMITENISLPPISFHDDTENIVVSESDEQVDSTETQLLNNFNNNHEEKVDTTEFQILNDNNNNEEEKIDRNVSGDNKLELNESVPMETDVDSSLTELEENLEKDPLLSLSNTSGDQEKLEKLNETVSQNKESSGEEVICIDDD